MNKSLLLLGLIAAGNTFAADEVKPLTLDGEFGFISTTGNTETTSVKGKLAAHQELTQWSNDYALEALYKEDEIDGVQKTTAQKYFLSGQVNYKLENPSHRLFGFDTLSKYTHIAVRLNHYLAVQGKRINDCLSHTIHSYYYCVALMLVR